MLLSPNSCGLANRAATRRTASVCFHRGHVGKKGKGCATPNLESPRLFTTFKSSDSQGLQRPSKDGPPFGSRSVCAACGLSETTRPRASPIIKCKAFSNQELRCMWCGNNGLTAMNQHGPLRFYPLNLIGLCIPAYHFAVWETTSFSD